MANVRVQMSLNTSTGIPEDRPVNTIHMVTPLSPVWSGATSFTTAVKDFYTSFHPYLSPDIAQNGHTIKVYDLADPEPRAPIFSGTWDFTSAPGGTPLPQEVALCISFQAEQVSGEVQARKRGRIYIGPFDTTALGTSGRPASGLVTDLATAFETFVEYCEASLSMFPGVYSRVDETLYQPLEDGWVDNAFDTQRRRGVQPTARTLFNITH